MAHTQSAMKRLRQAIRATERNRALKERFKKLRKDTLKLVVAKDIAKARELFVQFQQAVDKAAKRHAIHANTASRYKSRVMARLNKS